MVVVLFQGMSYSKAPEGVWITSLMWCGVGKELLTMTALKWNKFLVRDRTNQFAGDFYREKNALDK